MTLAICLILGWVLASVLGMQRMLRWWYQRQTLQLDSEAERIREGLLQELFVVRRSLEMALMGDQTHPKEVQQWLRQMETMQHSLEAMTHRLSPPYVAHSLPLAIQHRLKSWQQEQSACLEMDLPNDWQPESIELRRVILTTLEEWLHIVTPHLRSEAALSITLKQQATSGQLTMQLTAPTASVLLSRQTTALDNLQQFFQVLTSGKCYCRRQDSTVTWCYQWRSSRAKQPESNDYEPGSS